MKETIECDFCQFNDSSCLSRDSEILAERTYHEEHEAIRQAQALSFAEGDTKKK